PADHPESTWRRTMARRRRDLGESRSKSLPSNGTTLGNRATRRSAGVLPARFGVPATRCATIGIDHYRIEVPAIARHCACAALGRAGSLRYPPPAAVRQLRCAAARAVPGLAVLSASQALSAAWRSSEFGYWVARTRARQSR